MSLLPEGVPFLEGGDVLEEVSMTYRLSSAMGGMIITHYARTRGWFPDELVTCVRSGDGRFHLSVQNAKRRRSSRRRRFHFRSPSKLNATQRSRSNLRPVIRAGFPPSGQARDDDF